VHCLGKRQGKRSGCTPLRPENKQRWWVPGCANAKVNPKIRPFLTPVAGRLSRDAIECLLTKYTHLAARSCPSLKRKEKSRRMSFDTLRPWTFFHHGVDRSVIALWLGARVRRNNSDASSRGHAF